MFTITLIARPLIGAVIGYITNDIAIRMLFRPRRPRFIGRWQVPFTPGLIPKEKARIAASIGDAVSKNLMNTEVLQQWLLSDEMTGKIRSSINSYIDARRSDRRSIEQFLESFLKPSEIEVLRRETISTATSHIHRALASSYLGDKIASIVVDHAIAKIDRGFLGIFAADKLLQAISRPLASMLAKNIDEMLRSNSYSIVGGIISDFADNLLDMRVCNIVAENEDRLTQASDTLLNIYRAIVTERLPRILEAIDISRIIETRINDMDVEESERIILEVARKELKAIVWLGALLGFLMGCINLLF
ncbi:MAG: DUF445 family protein [Lachnoclostridium sp.]|nr:DUF445 family protein [Lachnoclostridium sp.]